MTVNQGVVGSSPTLGAKKKTRGFSSRFSFCFPLLRSHHLAPVNSQMLSKDGTKRSRVSEQTEKQPKTAVFRLRKLEVGFFKRALAREE